ncbi:MAG: ABC transporter permease [Brevefilum fermentans]|jgi:ribose transport system permease protein|uniref:Monosaccharide-transporting ATPase n=1 Tax=Candidatus Brevifilum fermentans TaxID=1986204 RepID=A0A1Y6K782_9CHLR|nr:ABC transporter permease [Brevefilum fermentans]MDI9565701.1 ABC transporter permease [Chloroflexota bacterium]SMX54439.1 Monosaccharide-transporting ATPase [Brevefilum fermentans]
MPDKKNKNIINWFRAFNKKHAIGVPFILLAVSTVLFFSLQTNVFQPGTIGRLTNSNFRTWLPVLLLTMGQTLVLIGGGLDLSNGSIVSVGNVILALHVTSADEPWHNLAIVALVIGFGLAAGFLNGILTVYLGLQPVIVTFATSFIYAGLALLLLPSPGGAIPREYTNYYRNTHYLGIPISLIILIVFLLIWEFFRLRKYGRFLYAVGGNPRAAYTTGVPVTWMKISTYILSGFLASLGAISYSLLTGSGFSGSGADMMLPSITGAIIGGVSFSGGSGSLLGAIFGGIVLGNIRRIISIVKVDSWAVTLINALVILFALAAPGFINLLRRKK